MGFKDEFNRVNRQFQTTYAMQDHDVMDFARVVRDFYALHKEKKLGHDEYVKYLTALQNIYRKRYKNIASTLSTRSNGRKIMAAVYVTLFGGKFDERAKAGKDERAAASGNALGNIVSAIRYYYRKHAGELKTHLVEVKLRTGFAHPGYIGNAVMAGVVEDVQVVLRSINREDVIEAVLNQKATIKQGLHDLFIDILAVAKASGIPPPSSGRGFDEFINPIYEKIILEIEAKKKLIPYEKAA